MGLDWWQWVFLAAALVLFLTVVFYGVQARRRRGGIVAQRSGRKS